MHGNLHALDGRAYFTLGVIYNRKMFMKLALVANIIKLFEA